MKAVVVEIRDKYAAALSDDGRVYKIKNENYIIGQRIVVKKQMFNKGYTKIIASIAAACAIFVVPVWGYYTPYSYVSIDINPSIEYRVNIFDRVIKVNSVNDDGEDILNKINRNALKNKNIEVAVKKVIGEVIEGGYITDGECDVVIASSSKKAEKSDELNLKLKSTIEEEIKKETNILNVQVKAITVDKNHVEAAKELGVTPGKLNLVEKLQETAEYVENTEEINVGEWLEKPVKEIVKAQKQYNKDIKEEEKQEKKADKETEKESKKEEKIKEKEEKSNEKEVKETIINNEKTQKNDKDNSNNKTIENSVNENEVEKNNANNNKSNSKVEKQDNNKDHKSDKVNKNKNDKEKNVKKSDSNSKNNNNKNNESNNNKKDNIEINNLVCDILSINEKENSITILRSNDKSLVVYLENSTKVRSLGGKPIKIDDLKEEFKINIDIEYKNKKFVATFIEVIE